MLQVSCSICSGCGAGEEWTGAEAQHDCDHVKRLASAIAEDDGRCAIESAGTMSSPANSNSHAHALPHLISRLSQRQPGLGRNISLNIRAKYHGRN